MPSGESMRFIRVNYDDSRKFPWVVMWGADHEWCSCRTLRHADYVASELRGVCDVFCEWKASIRHEE